MKKITVIIVLTTLFVTSVFAQNGVIREITGEVELRRPGSSVFVPASAGDTVNMNTIISTGFRSTAIVVIGSSTITVRPLTRLTLAEIQSAENTENINVNLQAGRVRVEVTPPAGTRTNFTVQSPSATASVRGTSFDFDTVNLSVHEGRVVFGGTSGPATVVNSGFVTFVGVDGTAENPAEVTSAAALPPAPVGTPTGTSSAASGTGDLLGDISIDLIYK
jgi:hypothetical protein